MHVHSGMPATLTFDQAVSLPVVWTTAHYCFAQAQLRSVQDVLVHAASGGVGLVSVEWARMARATTHATAGGMAKHVLLRSCNVVHLSSSRNAAACTSRLLRGRRVHSLVNALSNDFISVSLGLLACRGVFVEIGKNNIWSHGRSAASWPLVDFVAVAVDDGCRDCPGWNMDPWWFNRELRQLSAHAQAGVVQPLLLEGVVFEEHAVQAALRLLQRGANLGKMVVRVGRRESIAEERRAPSIDAQSLMHSPGRGRGAELGTLIRVGIDAETSVAVVELHDPERFNTMGYALGDDTTRAMNHLSRLGGIRALTLQGAGKTFCAGGNPYSSSGPTSLSASSRGLLASVQVRLLNRPPCTRAPCPLLTVLPWAVQGFVDMRNLRVPVVCAVHGAMVGGAAAIFLHTDLRVAERQATFQHDNLSRGVCPVAGACYPLALLCAVGWLRYASAMPALACHCHSQCIRDADACCWLSPCSTPHMGRPEHACSLPISIHACSQSMICVVLQGIRARCKLPLAPRTVTPTT